MRSGQLLTLLLASVVILSFAIIMVKEDALSQEADYSSPAYLSIREVDVRPVEVTSAVVEVNVTAYITHTGGRTENSTMLLRAISTDTGLLSAQEIAPIPQTPGTATEKTLVVSQHLNMERNGGYELKILLFDNGSIRDSGSVAIRGLNAITPQSRRSGIVLNNIDFMPVSASGGRVSIRSDVYLENRGAGDSDNLNLIIKARQADSNLLADKKDSETGFITSEATAVKSVMLDVPDGYNYMVVVELWKGDILINSWEKPVLLAPTKTVPKESEEKRMNIEVSKFVREGAIPIKGVSANGIAGSYAGTPKGPGFEFLAAIIPLALIIALRRRSKW